MSLRLFSVSFLVYLEGVKEADQLSWDHAD